jgi:hypothetical protein
MCSRLIERHRRRQGSRITEGSQALAAANTEQQGSRERDLGVDGLVASGLGDDYEAEWGEHKQVMARVCFCEDSPTGLALRVWGTDITELFVSLREDLRCVAVMTRREPGESGETVVGVPCGVLGDPHLLLHEDASDAEIQSLSSHGGALLDDGRSVSAYVARYGSSVVLEVHISDGPTVIVELYEGSSQVLSIQPGVRRLRSDPEVFEPVLHIWVPEDVLSDRGTSFSPDLR